MAKEADNRFLNDLDVDKVSIVGGKRVWYQTYLGANTLYGEHVFVFSSKGCLENIVADVDAPPLRYSSVMVRRR